MTGQSKENSTKKKQVTAGLDEIIEQLSSLKWELILKYLVINELDCINECTGGMDMVTLVAGAGPGPGHAH